MYTYANTRAPNNSHYISSLLQQKGTSGDPNSAYKE